MKRSPENFGIKTNLKRPLESSDKSTSYPRTFDRTYRGSYQFRMRRKNHFKLSRRPKFPSDIRTVMDKLGFSGSSKNQTGFYSIKIAI